MAKIVELKKEKRRILRKMGSRLRRKIYYTYGEDFLEDLEEIKENLTAEDYFRVLAALKGEVIISSYIKYSRLRKRMVVETNNNYFMISKPLLSRKIRIKKKKP